MPPPTPHQQQQRRSTPPHHDDQTPSTTTKRKRRDDGAVDVTDAEVEEFDAILRRVRGAAPPRAAAAAAWSPAFAWEDFAAGDGALTAAPVSAAAAAAAAEEKDAAPRALDLNADPEPEGDRGGDESKR